MFRCFQVSFQTHSTATLDRPEPDLDNAKTQGFYLLDSDATLTSYVNTHNVYNLAHILCVHRAGCNPVTVVASVGTLPPLKGTTCFKKTLSIFFHRQWSYPAALHHSDLLLSLELSTTTQSYTWLKFPDMELLNLLWFQMASAYEWVQAVAWAQGVGEPERSPPLRLTPSETRL